MFGTAGVVAAVLGPVLKLYFSEGIGAVGAALEAPSPEQPVRNKAAAGPPNKSRAASASTDMYRCLRRPLVAATISGMWDRSRFPSPLP